MPATYTSTDFTIPRELQGSGARVFSEFNTSDFILTRLFYQAASAYKALPISTPDYQYKLAYLVSEVETKRDGYGVYFTRTYATIPTTRTEGREVLYTFPGRCGVLENSTLIPVSATGVGAAFYQGLGIPSSIPLFGTGKTWYKYGLGAPFTAYRNATVTYSYSLDEPEVQPPFIISFGGTIQNTAGDFEPQTSVDFVGTVYTPDGSKVIGITNPSVLPSIFIVSDTARRWKGNIWEKELVTVTR